MVEESAQASDNVYAAVGQSLQAKSIGSVLKSPFDKPEVETLDQDRKYTLANIQALYDALLPKLLGQVERRQKRAVLAR